MSPSLDMRELAIVGSFVLTPRQHMDNRGSFCEWYRADALSEAIGHPLGLAQANCSVSRKGVLRGIHFADVPPGQAKYVTCPSGAVLDVVVDVRVGSPTFGQWDSVVLDSTDRRGIYIPEGLGHAFFALTDDATVIYLCSTGYAPGREHGITPYDPDLDITWPAEIEPVLSDKDRAAQTLAAARTLGLLPTFGACLSSSRDRVVAHRAPA